MRTLTCPEPEGALFSACFCVSFSLVSSLDLPLRVDGQLSVPSVLYLPQFPHFWGCCGHSALLCQPHDTLRRSRCGHRGRRAESGSVPQEGQRNQGLRPRGSPRQTLALHVPPTLLLHSLFWSLFPSRQAACVESQVLCLPEKGAPAQQGSRTGGVRLSLTPQGHFPPLA